MLQEMKAVFGACLTGAGFGGACMALVAAGKAEAIA
jgi:galactokinase